MKPHHLVPAAGLGLLLLFGVVAPASADITIRLSVKFILTPGGTRPAAGSIGTTTGFDSEVSRGNGILAVTARGYSMVVVEYIDIRPPVPGGQASDYWYNMDARANRQTIENAAVADQATWRWNNNAVNLYVNNSSSGQCSFPGTGGAITLGNDIGLGTVLHEVGHFMNLAHTHSGDPSCDTPPFPVSDGDGLAETIPDHPCLDRDGLSRANFGGRNFNQLTAGEQAQVNSTWLNVMSYHQEDQLLTQQMDDWTDAASSSRRYVCTGRTWFVDRNCGAIVHNGGSHCNVFGAPFNTVGDGVNNAQGGDIVMIRAGSYNEPMTINKAITLRSTRGQATIGQ